MLLHSVNTIKRVKCAATGTSPICPCLACKQTQCAAAVDCYEVSGCNFCACTSIRKDSHKSGSFAPGSEQRAKHTAQG
eukprot:17609-Heterococcus_DN1.PRE.2